MAALPVGNPAASQGVDRAAANRIATFFAWFTASKRRALLGANGHDDRASASAASPAAVGAGNGCGASWRGGNGTGSVGVCEVELAAIDGSVPVDRTILVPVSHVAVVDDAQIVGVFMAAGGELCSVEGQTTRDVGGRDGDNNRRRHGD